MCSHARHADGSAKIRIDTLEPIETTLGRRQLRLVLAWADLHQEEPLENWRPARAGENTAGDRPAPMIGLTPDITSVAVVRHGVLRLTFADGLTGEVDLLDRMRGPVLFERPHAGRIRAGAGQRGDRNYRLAGRG